MAPSIPDRWLNYTPIGQRVKGTRFIAFKVPLREAVNQNVEKQLRLDDSILLNSVPNLGMIIDLTNTSRYYTPDSFVKRGLEYKKLMIPGHHTPPPNLVDEFKKIVVNFLNKNSDNDKLIGVHCTHGVNRTGYLICNYMISELDVKPEDAIDKFNLSRGHKIERKNYLDSLYDLTKAPKDANSPLNNVDVSKRVEKPLNEQPSKELISWRASKDVSRRVENPLNEAPSKEPISWRASKAPPPPLPPSQSPKEFDRRDRFERVRQEAYARRQRLTSAANAAAAQPARQFLDNSFPNSQRNERNYSSRYVNTNRHFSQGGTSYPLPNHHNYDTMRSHYNQYVDYAQDNHRYEDNTFRRRYQLDNRAPQRHRDRNQPYRRI
uniref:RNA/RNP complex-1-interacting phosphatase n=1 Tax=Zeugodacus cucurbitae TaxID=28588 RepID=A0A0A1XEH6_ZEUCU